MHKKQIINNLLWSLVPDLLFSAIGILFYIYLARQLGESGLGLYSYLVAIMAFINVGLDLGVTGHYWRIWTTDLSHLRDDLQNILSAKFFLSSIVGLTLATYVLLTDLTLWPYFLLIYIVAVFEGIRSMQQQFFRSQSKFQYAFAISASERFTAFAGGLSALYLGYGISAILLSALLGQVVSQLLAFYLLPLPWPHGFSRKIWKILQLGLPIFIISFFNSSYQKVDTVIIRFVLGLDAVGLYSASYRILDSLLMIPSIVILAFFPALSQIYSQADREGLRNVLNLSLKYLGVLSAFIAFFFTFYANEILHFLYGDDYIYSGKILAILGWGAIFFFLSAPLYSAVLATKQDWAMTKRLLFLNFLNATGNILLLPLFGLPAAATVTVFTEILSFILLVYIVKEPLDFHWIIPVAFVLGCLSVWFHLIHLPLFTALLISGTCYVVLLFILKTIKPSDLL